MPVDFFDPCFDKFEVCPQLRCNIHRVVGLPKSLARLAWVSRNYGSFGRPWLEGFQRQWTFSRALSEVRLCSNKLHLELRHCVSQLLGLHLCEVARGLCLPLQLLHTSLQRSEPYSMLRRHCLALRHSLDSTGSQTPSSLGFGPRARSSCACCGGVRQRTVRLRSYLVSDSPRLLSQSGRLRCIFRRSCSHLRCVGRLPLARLDALCEVCCDRLNVRDAIGAFLSLPAEICTHGCPLGGELSETIVDLRGELPDAFVDLRAELPDALVDAVEMTSEPFHLCSNGAELIAAQALHLLAQAAQPFSLRPLSLLHCVATVHEHRSRSSALVSTQRKLPELFVAMLAKLAHLVLHFRLPRHGSSRAKPQDRCLYLSFIK
mmetsp:Transcript_26750/g.70956  ORF Transcript_26750/g.70956 Transcript_26750/m.70956 type:complete len:375 (-) Transcript_26750:687-1811(-)